MWPQTLNMSRDECRGMLRRLELESYSHIISVFRAQGSLSEPKVKLLEELRQLFHITQERHCAEVRRAANDEQLCTIAENVCGPNTWQEWSREGRRPYPLLPRISPQTALSIVANDLAAKAYAENAKLAEPMETGANLSDALREQANYLMLKHGISKSQEPRVVMDEPFKVPDLPNEIKKATLKRKENEAGDAKPNKKRNTHQDRQLGQGQQYSSHLSAGKDEDGQLMPLEQRPNARTLQQRYFYQQQQKHKQRLASKKGAGNALANHSGVAGAGANTKPAKSGRRRAQKQLQQQLQQKQQQEQQQQQQQQQKVLLSAMEPLVHPNSNHLVQPHVEYILDEALKSVAATKLKPLPLKHSLYATLQSPTAATRSIVNSPVVFKEKLSPTVAIASGAAAAQQQQQHHQQQPQQQQQQQLSTPVKKYIVEERQAGAVVTQANVSTANLPLAPQIISVQQIAAPPKVRTTSSSGSGSGSSTSILQPGSKLTPKKINLLDKQQLLPSVSNSALRLLAYDQQSVSGTNLSNTSKGTTAAAASPAVVQKYIVEERVPSQSLSTTPSQTQSQSQTTPLSSASAVNIIKNIPASSLNNTLITPLSNAGAAVVPVFRKATTTTASGAAAGTTASGSPTTSQILGNIKLTSASGIKHVPSSALRNIKICSPNGKVFLQPAKLHAGSIIHKLNTANVAGSSGTTSVTVSTAALSPTGCVTPTSPQPTQQRITIQKMQLLTPSQVSGTSSVGGAKVKPTTLTLGAAGVGKNNLVFLPTSGMRAVTLASSKSKTGADLMTAKPNVLVIGPASSSSPTSCSSATNVANNSQSVVAATTSSTIGKAKSNQLITEDTPIDIINMPIIVADNGAIETPEKTPVKAAPVMLLNATDWEMELDQASKAAIPTSTTIATATATSAATTTTAALTNAANSKKLLEDVFVDEVRDEEVDEAATTHLNSRIIELKEEDVSAIEYVDMELEQPIEIESTSNISAQTMSRSSSNNATTISINTSTTTSSTTTPHKLTILRSPSLQEPKKLDLQATKVEIVTAAATAATSTTTLP